MEQVKRNKRKNLKGIVVSNKMSKTAVVNVEKTLRHSKYNKVVRRKTKVYAHHEDLPIQVGDTVEIAQTRPLSKLKCWRVVEHTPQ